MYIEILLFVVIGLVLLGLTQFTENILDIRQRERDRGIDTKTYL